VRRCRRRSCPKNACTRQLAQAGLGPRHTEQRIADGLVKISGETPRRPGVTGGDKIEIDGKPSP
jgi:hypothetical protein